MSAYFHFVRSKFSPTRPVPPELRRNFFFLYLDIAFWGILNGTTLIFLSVYAARIGASGAQIGMIGAVPALINLIFTFPSGSWLKGKPIQRTVSRTSVAARAFYFFLAPLPLLLPQEGQVWAIIIVTLLMSIPGTAVAVGFQAMFAEAVPDEWRAYVAGVRNAVFSVVITVTALVSGQLLETIPFPHGYVWLFLAGFLGAIGSSWALISLRCDLPKQEGPENKPEPGVSLSKAGTSFASMLRLDILKTPFARVIGLLFAFHLTQYLPIPVFPIFSVHYMNFTDQIIGLGNAVFYISVSIGSTQLVRVSEKFGHRGAVAIGAILLALYPGLLSITTGETLYLITSIVGGLAWSLVGGAIYNYLLEKIPFDDRPGHLAWYNLVFNAGILIGSLAGPFMIEVVSIPLALAIFAGLRFASGFAILKWG